MRVLKLQFQSLAGTLGGTLISALKPALRALNNFMTKVIQVVENIANALGKIFGWTIETTNVGTVSDDLGDSTTDATDAIADGYDDATAAAKEYENTVLSIDELHKLNDTTDSSGSGSSSSGDSGSGSSSGSGYTSVIKQTESLLDYYESSINNLYELGAYIGGVLTKALNDIDWDSVYEGARNFGTGLAEFLNGLISPGLFAAVGQTIAGALNTAIYASLSFATTFDWTNLGESIAAGINKFFDTFDFKALAQSINAWVQGIWTTIKTAVREIEWKDIFKGVWDFLSELDIETVGLIIGSVVIKKILSATAGKGVVSSLESLITKALFAGGWSSALTLGVTATIAVTWAIVDWVQDTKDAVEETGWSFGSAGAFEMYFGEGASSAFQEALKNAFTEKQYEELNEEFEKGFVEKIKDITIDIKAKIATKWSDLKDDWKNLTKNIKDKVADFKGAIKQKWSDLKSKWGEIADNIKDKVATFAGQIKQKWSDLKDKWTEITDNIKDKFATFKGAITQKWSDLKDKWTEITGNIKDEAAEFKGKIEQKWEDLQGDWEAITSNIQDITANIIAQIVTTWENLKSKWEGIKQKFEDSAVVEVAIEFKTKASELWQKFLSWWRGEDTEVEVDDELSNDSGTLWNDLKTSWGNGNSKIVGVNNTLSNNPKTLWNNFSTTWGNGSSRKVGINNTLSNNAKTLWDNFSTTWGNGSGRKVGINNTLSNNAKTLWDNFCAGWKNKTLSLKVEYSTNVGAVKKAVYKALGLSGWPTIKFAAGGFLGNLSSADLLVTRENGIPEMIGRIGSQTAVANNDQIAAGIAAAVQPAVYNAIMSANASGGGSTHAEFVLEIDGDEIGRVAENYKKLQNKRYTVEPSFV